MTGKNALMCIVVMCHLRLKYMWYLITCWGNVHLISYFTWKGKVFWSHGIEAKFLPKSSQLGIFAVYIMNYSITPYAFIKVILQTPKSIGASLLPLSNVLSSSTCYNWLMITEKLKWQKWPVHAHENSIEGKRIKLLFDCQQFLILAGMDNRYFNDLNVAAFVTGQAEFQTSKYNVKMQ